MGNRARIEGFVGLLTSVVIVAVLTLMASALLSRCVGDPKPSGEVRTVERDTIVVRDTIRIVEPSAKDSVMIGSISERLPVATTADADSADVVIPIEQKLYEGEDYKAWVSGFRPSLDSLEVYPQRVTLVETRTVREPPRRWGLSVGAGAVVTPDRIEPGLFLGVSYTFMSF